MIFRSTTPVSPCCRLRPSGKIYPGSRFGSALIGQCFFSTSSPATRLCRNRKISDDVILNEVKNLDLSIGCKRRDPLTAVQNDFAAQTRRGRNARNIYSLTSTVTSVSTGESWLSEATPTAARVCSPCLPQSCTNKSDSPLTTFGISVKPGATFT
jgi:hypothetical protein